LAELRQALGEEWAEDDPVFLQGYFRDISTIDGVRPQIVALPSTTEEVQKVVRIAGKHKVPLVPLSTGFNIAGLTLPRVGGILLDLKRMDKVLKVDTENMAVTFQPYVRNAALQAEVNRFAAAEGLRLRIANPITVGAASYFGNIMSGGMSVNAVSTGMYHEYIGGQVWVLPDGEILRTRSAVNPSAPPLGNFKGPGPDISGMFYNAEGMMGVCTEMTVSLFIDFPFRKMVIFRAKDMLKDSTEQIVDFIYAVARENIADDIYKSSNITLTALMGPIVEEVAPAFPEDLVLVTLTGSAEEEIRIKERKLRELMKKHHFVVIEKQIMALFYDIVGLWGDDFANLVFRKCYTLGGIMRWRGCFYFLGCATTMDRIPDLTRQFNLLIQKHFQPLNPPNTLKTKLRALGILLNRSAERLQKETGEKRWRIMARHLLGMALAPSFIRLFFSKKMWARPLYPAHTAIQGPFPLGRGCWFELDMWYNRGDAEDRERIRRFETDCADMMIDMDLFIPRDFANAFSRQFPKLGIYRELVIKLKKEMDPDGIMNTKILGF
jgi:FAD/FMN-containing dehydrogenase